MTLVCPNCDHVRVLTPEEQRQIVAELKAQGPAAQKLLECGACGRGQWGIALDRRHIRGQCANS